MTEQVIPQENSEEQSPENTDTPDEFSKVSVKEEIKPAPPEEKKKRGTAGVTFGGEAVDTKEFLQDQSNYTYDWPSREMINPTPEINAGDVESFFDYQNFSSLNRAINNRRYHHMRASEILNKAKRLETEAQTAYKSAYNRAILNASGGTDQHRKALAELSTETLYNNWKVAETVVSEVTNTYYTIGRDLEVLRTLSDNFRKQMNLAT